MHNRPVLDQDFLRRIADYDNSAVKQLIQMINDDIDQLCALFKRPDFSLAEITALIQVINAETACMMGSDNFKEDRAKIRVYLKEHLIYVITTAFNHKNHEQLRDGLSTIMDKKTGLAIIHGGIMKKTVMQRFERMRDFLNTLIKDRDARLIELIHAENLEEVKRIINAGGKVDWAIFLKGKKIDFTKGPAKTLVDLIKDDMVALVEGLHTDNVNNLIAVVNQKTRYFSDDAKFRLAMEDMLRFFHEKILRLNFSVESRYPKEYLKGVNAVLEALDLVRWTVDVPQRGTLSALLYNAQISLKRQLETINSQLMDAIKKGNLEGVNRAIFNGADINHLDREGRTPLEVAVLSGCLFIVVRLMYMEADLSDISRLIHHAVGLSRYDIAEFLIIKGINIINEKRNTQDSLVKWVAENKKVQLLLILINAGVEIDWSFIKANVDESGVSFLRDQLIGLGVDPKTMGLEAPRPVVLPESKPELEPELEPVVNSSEFFDSREPVVDLEAKDAEGYTVLMNAARYCWMPQVKTSLKAGATIDWGALLQKLRKDQGPLKKEQRGNVYKVLTLLSRDDIDALVVSSGGQDTDQLINEINEKTSYLNKIGYNNDVAREDIRNRLTSVFEDNYALKSNPHLFSVLDKVLGQLNIIQGKGRENGIKTAMHRLQMLRKKRTEGFLATIETGNLDEIEKCFSDGSADVNGEDANGMTPLLLAIKLNKNHVVALLLKKGAVIQWDNQSEEIRQLRIDALNYLSGFIKKDIVSLLKSLEGQKNNEVIHAINQMTRSFPDPKLLSAPRFNLAAYFMDIFLNETARFPGKYLRRTNVSVVLSNFNNMMNQLEMVGWMKDLDFYMGNFEEFKSKLEKEKRMQSLLLLRAIDSRNMASVKDALAAGADFTAKSPLSGQTALMFAEECGDRELMVELRERSAELSHLPLPVEAAPTKPVVSDNPLTNGLISEEFRELIDATDAKAIADLIESINKKTEGSIQAKVVDDLVKVVSEKREALAKTQDEPALKAVHSCLTTVAAQLNMVESSDVLKQALNNLIEHLKARMDHLADVVKVPPGRPHTVFRELTRKEKKAQEKAEKEKPYKNIKDIEKTNYFGADDKGFFTL